MNKYHVKKKMEYWTAEDNITSFMKWGLESTYAERFAYLVKQSVNLLDIALQPIIDLLITGLEPIIEAWKRILNDN